MPRLKEIDYLKAWAFFWVLSTIGGFIVGALAGAVAGAILGVAHVPLNVIKIICGGLGLVLSIPISYFLFRWSVIQWILPKAAEQSEQVPPPSQPYV